MGTGTHWSDTEKAVLQTVMAEAQGRTWDAARLFVLRYSGRTIRGVVRAIEVNMPEDRVVKAQQIIQWTERELAILRQSLRDNGDSPYLATKAALSQLHPRKHKGVEDKARRLLTDERNAAKQAKAPIEERRIVPDDSHLSTLAELLQRTQKRCPNCGSMLFDDRADRLYCLTCCWSRHYRGER